MKMAERIKVNRGVVKIKVIASDTGIRFTHVNAVSITRLPITPTKESKTLRCEVFGINECPKNVYGKKKR